MAVRSGRERESGLLQVAAFGGAIAILLLAGLVYKTLSFDLGQHQQRLDAIHTVGSLDGEITQLFLRSMTNAKRASGDEQQQASIRLAAAVDALQQGPAKLLGLSNELDTALNLFLDTLIKKFDRGREFDAQNARAASILQEDFDGLTLAPQSERLAGFVNLPTAEQLAAVENAYQTWFQARIDETNFYRTVLAGYSAFLLLALGYLAYRLGQSYRALDKANLGLKEANRTLESQVQARTKDLSSAITNLQESQAQLVQSEKMASLGQMVAGVAHEINTPLGYARSNAEIVRTSLGDIRTLSSAQALALRLMTSDDSSEADIAAAMAQAEEARQNIPGDELLADLDNLLADTDHGLLQIADLVSSLKDFSRVDRSRTDLFDLNSGVDSALKICNSQLKGRVEVVRKFSELPEIECSPSQINQVFLNLINNAAQAIANEGTITITTAAEKGGVVIRVADTGSGMSAETQKRIFEPFFTTKPVGKGTGLGLSIVFRIVEEHGGRIAVQSKEEVGTIFSLFLPLRQPKVAA